jgi:hypothetical protein
MSHATKDLDAILLYLHPTAATIAPLPAFQIVIDQIYVDRNTCGHAFDNRHEGATV